jgi:hypothetical protein
VTPLTKPAVDANALETTVLNLWYEFLTRYFDGQPHAIGATPEVEFPKVELQFQQSAVSQPLDQAPASGVAITMVWSEGDRRRWTAWEFLRTSNNPNGERQEICYERVAWNFWVRASGSNGRANGKLASDRLFGLLGNRAETHALGQKGICRIKAAAPRAIQDTDYVLRLVTVTATLRYPILSQI